jgi:hypothetical protein
MKNSEVGPYRSTLTFPTLKEKPKQQSVTIDYVEDGNVKSVRLDPMSTNLGNGEVHLWSYIVDTK